MKNKYTNFIKKYWLPLLLLGIIIILLLCYIVTFNGGLSNEHSHWGDFGDYFGAIAGLLAFVGILYTLIQSRDQVLSSEERQTFFSLLEIFREHRKNIVIEKAEIVIEIFGANRKIIKNEFVTGDTSFKQLAEESVFFFWKEILSDAPRNITKEKMTTILQPEETEISTSNEYYEKRFEAIKTLYLDYNIAAGYSYISPSVGHQTWQWLACQIIQLYIREKRYDALNYAMMRAGERMYSLYKNQLGPYHRNMFYVFDIVSKFRNSNNYGLLFRAQLSKDELIVVFFNSFSVESNPTARKYFLDNSLFNNLAWSDVWMNMTRAGYYVDNELLGLLFEAANDWWWEQTIRTEQSEQSS